MTGTTTALIHRSFTSEVYGRMQRVVNRERISRKRANSGSSGRYRAFRVDGSFGRFYTSDLKDQMNARRVESPLESLSISVNRVYYSLTALLQRLVVETGLDQHQIVPGMGNLLFALFEEDNLIIKNLVDRVRMSPSALTAVLGRMEAAGLVTRSRDPGDGRAVRVRLTRLGRLLEPRCRALLLDVEAILRDGMTEAEVRQFKDLLSRTIANIRRVQQTPPKSRQRAAKQP